MKKEEKNLRTFRNVLNTLLIGLAIVFFWRGAWGLMDLYLFPSNNLLSYVVSVFIGITILYSTKSLIKYLI